VLGALEESAVGEQVIVELTPVDYRGGGNPRAPFRVMAQDRAGNVCALVYFGRNAGWARKQLPLNEPRWIAGRLDQFGPSLQIVHPEHVGEDSKAAMGKTIEPIYPLSEGMTQGLGALVQQALTHVPELPEWIEPSLKTKQGWPDWQPAVLGAHRGEDPKARDRLAYDELLANSLALMLVRASNRRSKGQPLQGDGRLRSKLALPLR
jgi:ATP-dependent DNA helicase RecG